MYVTEVLLEPQNFFTHDGETEMSRFNNARVHRTDRNFVHALAFDPYERVIIDCERRRLIGKSGIAQRIKIGGPRRMAQPRSLICIGAALGVWFLSRRAIAERAVLWFDAAGMAAYAAYGASKALTYGVAPVPAFVMGVLTACAGGIIRDVLANEPTILLRRELYITPAALAAGLFVGLTLLGMPPFVAASMAALAGFILRALAITRGLTLPLYSR